MAKSTSTSTAVSKRRKSRHPASNSPKPNRSRKRSNLNTQHSKPAITLAPDSSTFTKRDRILTMLRVPSGVSLASLAEATCWQHHSVRGFLAGVARKKLGLNLMSRMTENGRIYRIVDTSDVA